MKIDVNAEKVKQLIGKAPRKKLPKIIAVILAIALLVCVLSKNWIAAKYRAIGSDMGSVAGRAVGIADGLTRGTEEGYAAGKEAGLSAVDTTAEVTESIRETGVLEVLVANVKLSNMHKIGDEYAALYLLRGQAIFTVDLSAAKVEIRDNTIVILLPQPEAKLTIDDRETDKVAEWQKSYFSGSAEDGFDAYINTMKQIAENPAAAIANYETLMTSAKEAARTQVKLLVSAISFSDYEIEIKFADE